MQLTFEKDNCESPGWSPDGRYIAFTLKKGAAAQLAIIGSNGMNLRVLNSLDAAMSYDDPSWSSHILY
jgi:Tol biopolymer transport system component